MAVNRYYSSTAVDTTLASGITSSSTTMVVSSTQGYPTSYPFTLAVDYDTSFEELVNVVGASGTTLTLGTVVGTASTTGRGVDGTTAQSHNAGAAVKHVISGRDMREAQEHIAASTNVHGITDTSTLVTTTGTQTLTNKTLTAPAIANGTLSGTVTSTATISGGSLTGPAISSATITGGTMTGAALTGGSITGATVTNPAISGGSITGTVSGNPTFSGTVTLPSTTSIGNVSATEIGYVDGVTSAIQTQLDAKAALSNPTFSANITVTGDVAVNGGDITTTAGTFNIGNTATTSHTTNIDNAAPGVSAAKVINIGTNAVSSSSASQAINIGTGLLSTGSGQSSAVTVGTTDGTTTINGNVVLPSTTTIGSVSSTELGYLDGVTSAVQTQLNAKAVAGSSGIPLAMSAGAESASFSSSTLSSPVTITFPTGRFSNPPVITGSVITTSGNSNGSVLRFSNITKDTASATLTVSSSFTGSVPFNWVAIAMTSTAYTSGTAQ